MFYKYLKKKHLKQFRSKGTIAIGNIELYRDIENTAISDPYEGRTVYAIETEGEAVKLSVEQVNAITNDYHITANLEVGPHSFFRDSLKVPNAYAFSVSRKLDQQLMTTLGYDAYYKIKDIQGFMRVIYNELNRRTGLLFSVADRISYVETKTFKITNANKDKVIRTSPYNKSKSERLKTIYIEDYFTKLDKFQHEEEFRLLFIPAARISKQLVSLDCKELLGHCNFR